MSPKDTCQPVLRRPRLMLDAVRIGLENYNHIQVIKRISPQPPPSANRLQRLYEREPSWKATALAVRPAIRSQVTSKF